MENGKWKMKKILMVIVIVFFLAIVAILVIGRTFYPDNIAETSVNGGTKGLKSGFYRSDISTVSNFLKSEIPKLSTYGANWKVVRDSGVDSSPIINVEVPVLIFTDDLEVYLYSKNGMVEVNVKSRSRVGKSDFGENARHVRKLLKALDEKFDK